MMWYNVLDSILELVEIAKDNAKLCDGRHSVLEQVGRIGDGIVGYDIYKCVACGEEVTEYYENHSKYCDYYWDDTLCNCWVSESSPPFSERGEESPEGDD